MKRNSNKKFKRFAIVLICFLAVSFYALTYLNTYSEFLSRMSGTNTNLSGINGQTITVDDLKADFYYYQGLNYTGVWSNTIPSGKSTKYFDGDKLIEVQITYDGKDLNNNNLEGQVSPLNNETVNKYVYYKYYPYARDKNGTLLTNSNGQNYIHIDLIDNPFSKRPILNNTEYGFNGWVCNQTSDSTPNICSNTTFKYDDDYYVRYLDIPVTVGDTIKIYLNASWIPADVKNNSDNTPADFNDKGMQSATFVKTVTETQTGTYYRWRNNYYTFTLTRTVTNRGYVNADEWYIETNTGAPGQNSNQTLTYSKNNNGHRCARNYTCYVYKATANGVTANSYYNAGDEYIVAATYPNNPNTGTTVSVRFLNQYYNTLMTTGTGPHEVTHDVTTSMLIDNTVSGGYYYQVTNPTTAMINTGMYYNENGTVCTSATSCRTAYKLIQYNDSTLKSNSNSIYQVEKNGTYTIVDQDKYYYLVTRDTNIFKLNGTINANSYTTAKPYTLTGYNGNSITGVLTVSSGGNRPTYYKLTAYDDLVIENIKFAGMANNGGSNLGVGDASFANAVIYANSQNLKIGRNITNNTNTNYIVADSITGGSSNAISGSFKVIVESGHFNAYTSGTGASNGGTLNEITVFGSDYDRISGNNTKLWFNLGLEGYSHSNHSPGSDSLFVSMNYIKSGTFGYNGNGTASSDNNAGLYITARAGNYIAGITGAKIEGGRINNVVGGYGFSGSSSNNSTHISMTGGEARIIYGGAGTSATYGNRIISVTGGTVEYSVLGGSNSYSGSSTDGKLTSDTLVYIGGDATIGTSAHITNNDTLYNVESGSVFGAGGGRSGSSYTGLGTVNNSHVIINGGTILGSVYGGGNYGSTGTQLAGTSKTIIDVYDGDIRNSVFGGSKSSGFSQTNYTNSSTITINTYGGTVGNIYGGSDSVGTCYGATNINLYDGEVTGNVYGGGKGGYASTTNKGTYVSGNVSINVGLSAQTLAADTQNVYCDADGKPYIAGSIYGGSAFGTVNGTDSNTTKTNYTTTVIVNNASIDGSVFGGGQGNGTYTPYVKGNVTVTVEDGKITNVFGGNDQSGTPSGSVHVTIDGGDITNVYGGGNRTSVTTTDVDITGGNINKVFGGSNQLGNVTTSDVNVSGGTIYNVYGGNNAGGTTTNGQVTVSNGEIKNVYGGGSQAATGNTRVTTTGGEIEAIYGGGEAANVNTSTRVDVSGGTIGNVYGGSNTSGNIPESTINANNGVIGTIYGGNNVGGKTTTSNVNVNGAKVINVYGGGNVAETDESNVTITSANGKINEIYGGGKSASVDTTNVEVSGVSANKVFGGSNSAGTVEDATVTVTGTPATLSGVLKSVTYNSREATNEEKNHFNDGEDEEEEEPLINAGDYYLVKTPADELKSGDRVVILTSNENYILYPGNDRAVANQYNLKSLYENGYTETIDPILNDGKTYYKYDSHMEQLISTGKYLLTVSDGMTLLNSNGKYLNLLYRPLSGDTTAFKNSAAGKINTNGTITASFGGIKNYLTFNPNESDPSYGFIPRTSNSTGYTKQSAEFVFYRLEQAGENVFAEPEEPEYISMIDVQVTIANNTESTLNNYSGTINIPNSRIYSNESPTTITGTTNTYSYNQNGGEGTNSIAPGESYTFTFKVLSSDNMDDISLSDTFNSANYNSVTNFISYVYGGNNAGGDTTESTLDIDGGNIGYIYGGGDAATSGESIINLANSSVLFDIYGGGNQAAMEEDTLVDIEDSTIMGNVFGGGNAGPVAGNTVVNITDSEIKKSAFAGGNGTTAIVDGDSDITIDGESIIGESVFGGGNAASTGTSANPSTTTVKIVGADIGKNVYGGANTSTVVGATRVLIGYNAVNDDSLDSSDIHVGGTVFGGGEANASGSEDYDYNFISVEGTIDILIDGDGHDYFDIDGSIFGSGNASSSSGTSTITINNYGTEDDYKENISIQRANLVTISNSALELAGVGDRVNEYDNVLYSLSRIDHLVLKNGTYLYMKNGANMVKELSSGVDIDGTFTLAEVLIDEDGNHTENVDNRIYMYEGKNFNVATNENRTAFGNVNGMSFLGMYKYKNGRIYMAFYDPEYDNGDETTETDLYYFSGGSYVMGYHKTNHDIEKDGFYTLYTGEELQDEANANLLTVKYIEPTPDDADYYQWVIGVKVKSYEVNLTASKYITLGATELPLTYNYAANSSFAIVGADYDNLAEGVTLVDANSIPRIASSTDIADNQMSLVLKSGNNGWLNTGSTTFDMSAADGYTGTNKYKRENTNIVPSFVLYLYHSKNIATTGEMGSVTIRLRITTPLDDLNDQIDRVDIIVSLQRVLYSNNDYEATITEGKQYEMFASSETNISSTSSLSAYYTLFLPEKDGANPYGTGYHRTLVSDFVFPENTKITMIDFVTENDPEYYYLVMSASDVAIAQADFNVNGDASYDLSKFVKMGSTDSNNKYNDAQMNNLYYSSAYGGANEEFIFIIDFSEANISENMTNRTLLIELRNDQNASVVGVLSGSAIAMHYNLYVDSEAEIQIDAELDKNSAYPGEILTLDATTNYVQNIINNKKVYEDKYEDLKLGLLLSFYDSDGNRVPGSSLMGVSFTLDNQTYWPRVDGTTRINIAEKVANVSSRIKINISDNVPAGNYTLRVESFGCPDGIYYGLTTSSYDEVPLAILNATYGLKVDIDDRMIIIDAATGKNLMDNNILAYTITLNSIFTEPKIRLALQRRDYSSIYSLRYNQVDLLNYVNESYTDVDHSSYLVSVNLEGSQTLYLRFKDNLVSGTYRLVYSVYDGDSYIGNVYKYLIIK